jgi:streptomycin 6-kinase
MFDDHFLPWLALWDLTPDGSPIVTRGSRLLPVRCRGVPAMLKLSAEAEESFGGVLMEWWEGEGAARVLARQGDALLLERAESGISLADLVRDGRDDEASRIACAVVARLHAPRAKPLPEPIPLLHWFRELEPTASAHGGILPLCAATARDLLAEQQEVGVLHGDIHHGNILDFGPRGWLAIDPKRLLGDRCFDYTNLFCNPDLETATAPGGFARRVEVMTEAAGLEHGRLLRWILAWAGLSAAWSLQDGTPPGTALAVAGLAAAELGR